MLYENNNNNQDRGQAPQQPSQTPLQKQSTVYTNRAAQPYPNTPPQNYPRGEFSSGSIYPPIQPPEKPRKERKRHPFAYAVVVVAFAFIASIAGTVLGNSLELEGQKPVQQDTSSMSAIDNLVSTGTSTGGSFSVADVVDAVGDSVVEITTESVTTGQRMQQFVSTGAGSGVIISNDGYIITNNHVIADSTKITVTLRDGTQHSATLVGTDAKTDVAVIKITAEGLTAAPIGKSSDLKVGQDAIVIGNPLGQLGGTVSNGIISALDREITMDGSVMTLMQTNAAVNPGNSGGGMFNSKGELIGVINAKSSGADIEGIGFAIPIDTAITVATDLIQHGYVQGRVELGVSLIDIDDPLTAMMYRVNSTGVYVYSVTPDSGAALAGITTGDKITAINGKEITSSTDISTALDKQSVGDSVSLTIERENRTGNVNIVLQEANAGISA